MTTERSEKFETKFTFLNFFLLYKRALPPERNGVLFSPTLGPILQGGKQALLRAVNVYTLVRSDFSDFDKSQLACAGKRFKCEKLCWK